MPAFSSPLVALLCASFVLSRWSSVRVESLSTGKMPASRRDFLRTVAATSSSVAVAPLLLVALPAENARAAPPTAVIAEELGYFPMTNRDGDVVYIPKKVQRKSTDQAIELAQMLRDRGMVFYGAFWCPHCSRQKEIFGAEAFNALTYRECSPKGFGFKGACKGVDGYPTFRSKGRDKLDFSGERPLSYFAEQVGFAAFDPSLEGEVPSVGTTCKLPQRQ